jgi:hypothetical protein
LAFFLKANTMIIILLKFAVNWVNIAKFFSNFLRWKYYTYRPRSTSIAEHSRSQALLLLYNTHMSCHLRFRSHSERSRYKLRLTIL